MYVCRKIADLGALDPAGEGSVDAQTLFGSLGLRQRPSLGLPSLECDRAEEATVNSVRRRPKVERHEASDWLLSR
jgi:hypothetical protein